MIDPLVREADEADGEELERLQGLLLAATADVRGGQRWNEEHPPLAFDDVLERDRGDSAVFVGELPAPDAESAAVAVGYLVVVRVGAVATIRQVFVELEARELGFGDTMVEHALDWATEVGCEVIEGHALPGDRHMKNLFERAGITARLIVVSRKLES